MRKYEIMLILPSDADDSVVAGAVDRIGRIVQERGGSVTKVDKWGKRRFAYEIRRQSEGFYVVVESVGEPSAMQELDRVLTLADEVIRFKVVVRGEADGQAAVSAPGVVGVGAAEETARTTGTAAEPAEAEAAEAAEPTETTEPTDAAEPAETEEAAGSDEAAAREASEP